MEYFFLIPLGMGLAGAVVCIVQSRRNARWPLTTGALVWCSLLALWIALGWTRPQSVPFPGEDITLLIAMMWAPILVAVVAVAVSLDMYRAKKRLTPRDRLEPR